MLTNDAGDQTGEGSDRPFAEQVEDAIQRHVSGDSLHPRRRGTNREATARVALREKMMEKFSWQQIREFSKDQILEEIEKRLRTYNANERNFLLAMLDPSDERSPKKKAEGAKYHPALVRKMLADPQVRTLFRLAAVLRQKDTPISADRIAREYANIAFADLSNLIKPVLGKSGDYTGDYRLALEDATPDQMAALDMETELDEQMGVQKVKYRQKDRLAALDRLAKLMGFADGDNENSHTRLLEAVQSLMAMGRGGVAPGMYGGAQSGAQGAIEGQVVEEAQVIETMPQAPGQSASAPRPAQPVNPLLYGGG